MSLAAGARWSKVGVVDVEGVGVIRARLEFMIVVPAMYVLAIGSHDIMTERGFCRSISANGQAWMQVPPRHRSSSPLF